MSGFLDVRTRILDTIITVEGKKHLAKGKLDAMYYSFTDGDTFYQQDTMPSGSDDPGRRIVLEASNLPQDQITFKTNDSGQVLSFRNSTTSLAGGKIITVLTGNSQISYDNLSGSTFGSIADQLLNSSLQSFNQLRVLGSPDLFDENRLKFKLSKNVVDFTITNEKPIPKTQLQNLSVDHVESFFMDKRLSHVPNFMYLPPVNKAEVGTSNHTTLGSYPRLGQRPIFEYNDLLKELKHVSNMGFEQVVEFNETSRQNNLMCQFFELGNGEVTKLDVIDFGVFNVGGNEISAQEQQKAIREGRQAQLESTSRHVFFVGKVFVDSTNSHTFVNMFTLIFE